MRRGFSSLPFFPLINDMLAGAVRKVTPTWGVYCENPPFSPHRVMLAGARCLAPPTWGVVTETPTFLRTHMLILGDMA